MAMGKCRECGAPASSEAATCPNCGIKKPVKKASRGAAVKLVAAIGFLGLLGIALAVLFPGEPGDTPTSTAGTPIHPAPPPPRPLTPQEAQIAEAAVAARFLQRSMRNPDSFRIANILAIASTNAECIEYRAQNGFGGLNVERAVVRKGAVTVGSDAADAWNQYCARRSGVIITDDVERMLTILP
jgi:hypothetical protein